MAATKEIAKRARRPPRTPSVRLRRADTGGPGIRRRRAGRGFTYVDDQGARVEDTEVLARIHDLVIPPAWQDVWICPYPGGHIQATGIDARGRKQYLYHRKWRERRDQEKFDEMLRFARALPQLREAVEHDLGDRDDADMGPERVLATAVRLLDRGFFRIGSEDYAVENDTYGLATMRKEHVTVVDGMLRFDYPAKHGKRRVQRVVDDEARVVVDRLKRRRGGGEELLAYKRGGRWVDVRSGDINDYIKATTGEEFSAKAFRTWGATVLAAVALAVSPAASDTTTARKRAVTRAIKEVADHLGNTAAVARASYIDPRIIDRYLDGHTIAGALEHIAADPEDTAIQGDVEAAVIDLIEDPVESEFVESARDVLEAGA
jgi:DNA topoisomerase IB